MKEKERNKMEGAPNGAKDGAKDVIIMDGNGKEREVSFKEAWKILEKLNYDENWIAVRFKEIIEKDCGDNCWIDGEWYGVYSIDVFPVEIYIDGDSFTATFTIEVIWADGSGPMEYTGELKAVGNIYSIYLI